MSSRVTAWRPVRDTSRCRRRSCFRRRGLRAASTIEDHLFEVTVWARWSDGKARSPAPSRSDDARRPGLPAFGRGGRQAEACVPVEATEHRRKRLFGDAGRACRVEATWAEPSLNAPDLGMAGRRVILAEHGGCPPEPRAIGLGMHQDDAWPKAPFAEDPLTPRRRSGGAHRRHRTTTISASRPRLLHRRAWCGPASCRPAERHRARSRNGRTGLATSPRRPPCSLRSQERRDAAPPRRRAGYETIDRSERSLDAVPLIGVERIIALRG